jgi:hypothetical protein
MDHVYMLSRACFVLCRSYLAWAGRADSAWRVASKGCNTLHWILLGECVSQSLSGRFRQERSHHLAQESGRAWMIDTASLATSPWRLVPSSESDP